MIVMGLTQVKEIYSGEGIRDKHERHHVQEEGLMLKILFLKRIKNHCLEKLRLVKSIVKHIIINR